jgi:hypothetical protein
MLTGHRTADNGRVSSDEVWRNIWSDLFDKDLVCAEKFSISGEKIGMDTEKKVKQIQDF